MSTGNKMQWEWKGCQHRSRPFSYHISTANICRTSALVHQHQGWDAFFERRAARSLSLGHCCFCTLDYAVSWTAPKMYKSLKHIFTIVRNLFLSLFSPLPSSPLWPLQFLGAAVGNCLDAAPPSCNAEQQKTEHWHFCSSFVHSWIPFFWTSRTVFVMPTAKKCLGSRAVCIFYRIVELYR